LGTLLVAPLLLVPVLWAEQDPADREAVLATFSADGPPLAALPLERTPQVEWWVRTFQTTRRGEFDRLLARRGRYEALIRGKLRERGMPEELVYIPMIESDFSTYAVSPVSAVGLWQFMTPTAVQYGLRVDEWVDERRDPVRATDAALDYIQWLNRRFDGSWHLTVAAFNAGPGRTGRIVNRHGEGRSDDDVYWDVLPHLPLETRDYVPKLIAFSLLANEALSNGHPESKLDPYQYDSVFVPGGTHLTSIASLLGIDVSELRVLNPHLTRGITPPGEVFGVRVPVGQAAVVVDALSERKAD
jgi:membrane-bound lytic murein transglycosylase D